MSLDFRRRFLSLLSYKFREFGSVTALSILEAANVGIKDEDGDKMKGILSRLVNEKNGYELLSRTQLPRTRDSVNSL